MVPNKKQGHSAGRVKIIISDNEEDSTRCSTPRWRSYSISPSKGKIGVGATLNYLTEGEWLGAGAKLQYGVTNNIRLDANVTYYFPKYSTSAFDASLNAQYVIPVAEKFSIYPLAGLGIIGTRSSGEGSETNTEFAINLGGGASYQLTPSLSIGAEAKYMLIKNFNTPVIGANVVFSI